QAAAAAPDVVKGEVLQEQVAEETPAPAGPAFDAGIWEGTKQPDPPRKSRKKGHRRGEENAEESMQRKMKMRKRQEERRRQTILRSDPLFCLSLCLLCVSVSPWLVCLSLRCFLCVLCASAVNPLPLISTRRLPFVFS